MTILGKLVLFALVYSLIRWLGESKARPRPPRDRHAPPARPDRSQDVRH
jgi:hypothetical protein